MTLQYISHSMDNIIESLNINVIEVKKLSHENKATWLIVDDLSNKYIIKLVSPIRTNSIFRVMIRAINSGASMAFSTEIDIYHKLNKAEFSAFNYPKLLGYDKKRFILLEYIESKKGWDMGKIEISKVAKALYEFNYSNITLKTAPIFVNLSSYYRRSSFAIMKLSVSKIMKLLGFKTAFKCILVLCNCTIHQKKTKYKVLLHKDIIGRNNMLSSDSDIYFCDFESVALERRWILNDVIDVSLTLDLKCDAEVIEEYINVLKNNGVDTDSINVEAQVRIALLYRVIRRIFSKNSLSSKYRSIWIEFLCGIILDDNSFAEWYTNNVNL